VHSDLMDIHTKNQFDEASLRTLLTFFCEIVSTPFNYQFLTGEQTMVLVDGNSIVGVKDISLYFLNHFSSHESYTNILGECNNDVIELLTFRDETLVPFILSGEKKQLLPTLSKFNKSLDYYVFVLEHRISLADLVLFPCFYNSLLSWNEDERVRFDNITRWYDHMQHLPSLFGKIDFIKVDINQTCPPPKPKKQNQNQGNQPKQNNKKKKNPTNTENNNSNS